MLGVRKYLIFHTTSLVERDDEVVIEVESPVAGPTPSPTPEGSVLGQPEESESLGFRTIEDARKRLFHRSRFSNLPVVDSVPPLRKALGPQLHLFLAKVAFITITFLRLIRPRNILFSLVVAFLTHWCMSVELSINMNPSLFLTVIVFPLAFSVNAAYQRRENALQVLASLKANLLSTYLAHRSWRYQDGVPEGFAATSRHLVEDSFAEIRQYLQEGNEDTKLQHLSHLHQQFGEMFRLTDMLRVHGFPPPLLTRPFTDIKTIVETFESLRVFADYRTPSAIRSFIRVVSIVVPITLTPYYAYLGLEFWKPSAFIAGGVVTILFSCLTSVQRWLENPFASTYDQDGINMEQLRSMAAFDEGSSGARPRASSRSSYLRPYWRPPAS